MLLIALFTNIIDHKRPGVNGEHLGEVIMESVKAEKRVLTPDEVALELNVSRNLVYRQLRLGVIPHLKLGDKYLVSRATLEKLLSGGRSA